jgi:Vesicle coat protein involved in Golgi to plasma membrane transport
MALLTMKEPIVILTTFCEQCGPNILLCGQEIQSKAQLDNYTSLPPTTSSTRPQSSTGHPPAFLSRSNSRLTIRTSATTLSYCSGCNLLADGKPISIDDVAVSHTPLNQELYALARQACIQSLTNETPASIGGVGTSVLFGSDDKGWAGIVPFVINDNTARGGVRHYGVGMWSPNGYVMVRQWKDLETYVYTCIV